MRRHATLASISKRPEHSIATPASTSHFLDDTANLVRRAARMGADLVAFPEVYPQLSSGDIFAQRSRRSTSRMGEGRGRALGGPLRRCSASDNGREQYRGDLPLTPAFRLP